MFKWLILLCSCYLIQAYVECPDRVSACPDNFICCKSTDCYKCCPSNTYCCKGGNYCCKSNGELANGFLSYPANIVGPSKPTFDPKYLSWDILVVIDEFLKNTKFYNYDRSAGDISKFLFPGVDSFWRFYEVLNDKVLYENKVEYYSKVTYAVSELIYYIQWEMYYLEPVRRNADLPRTIEYIKQYIHQDGYDQKIFTNIATKLVELKEGLTNSLTAWNNKQFREAGKFLADAFKNIFIIN
jgi:hypothetical protein